MAEQKRNEAEKRNAYQPAYANNTDFQQFSFITSHNVRAPLPNILGLINLIDISSVTDNTAVTLLTCLEECTLQLNDTVNNLINILLLKIIHI